MREGIAPSIHVAALTTFVHEQDIWLHTHMHARMIRASQQLEWMLKIDMDAQGIWGMYLRDVHHQRVEQKNAGMWKVIRQQLPFVTRLGLVVLDAFSIATWLQS